MSLPPRAKALVEMTGAFRMPTPVAHRATHTDSGAATTAARHLGNGDDPTGDDVARMRVCSTPGCPTIHDAGGKCAECRAASERRRRPNGNPYATRGHLAFRAQVLAQYPYCQCRGECEAHPSLCAQPSTVANHWPHERRDLIDMGLDPNDPQYGRGWCAPCHDRYTARTTPGGWNARD